ncbi:MAG: biosynthetic arginine decarboxylase, partial [Kofleriaceae bacterium]|nr:biosynthetic arginine decarboxylase [Kofleriaceae bacterium]
MSTLPPADPLHRWSTHDAAEIYGVDRWGRGHFSISSEGKVAVSCNAVACDTVPRDPASRNDGATHSTEILDVVEELRSRGFNTPLLLRFSDILRARIETLNNAFASAIEESQYTGQYRGVFPIKVNQARTVVEEIVHFGRPFHYGLEAGSKAELLAILAVHKDPEALIVCNGYKDDDYVKIALLASVMGNTIILVAEKPSEIDRIHRISEELGVPASLGIRVRLSTPGAGKWQQSGGDLSKFGLSASEIVSAIEKLRAWGSLDSLRLLHFHLGSQISAIRSIKNALREAARIYVELRKMGASHLEYLDVGGGLGVDYDGSQTNFHSSMNYSIQEYANDVVHEVAMVCNESNTPHPNLVSESGRAISAHHSVLIVDVLEVTRAAGQSVPESLPDNADPVLQNFFESYQSIRSKNLIESFHDSQSFRDQALQLFNLGRLDLAQRVLCDKLYWASCRKIHALLKNQSRIPEELDCLERLLCDTYYLNFSLFQSLPDSWAIDQIFPILPIHRHREEPTRRGVLADITCDSDGRIDKFVDLRDVKQVLELHPLEEGKPYYMGIFLVGAYQEILGDLHNLFGDTHTAHISMNQDGYKIENVFQGEAMTEVLKYVNYDAEVLQDQLAAR